MAALSLEGRTSFTRTRNSVSCAGTTHAESHVVVAHTNVINRGNRIACSVGPSPVAGTGFAARPPYIYMQFGRRN